MPKKFILAIALILTIQLTINPTVLSAEESAGFALTEEEEEYLDSISGQPLTLDITTELMSFETKNGGFGLLKPLTDLLENEWGLTIEIKNCGWSEAFQHLDDGEADIIGLAVLSEERKKLYHATEPLYESTMDVYTRISDPLINITNLDNCVIGLVRGSALTALLNQYIRESTEVKYYDTIDEMFTALSEDEVDCVISSLNVQSELLRYPDITCEASVETVLPAQGLYTGKDELEPLFNIINRYLQSSSGEKLLQSIKEAKNKSVMEKAKECYAKEIEYLNTHYTELNVYDSGVLYPFHYVKNGVWEGIQEDINDMFYELTGMKINSLPADEFEEGFLTALEKIGTNEIIGATGIYYNKEYDLDPDYVYSRPLYTDKLGFYGTEELDSVKGLKIASTPFGSPYVDWPTIAGVDPIIYGNRGEMLEALREGVVDIVFVSEMSVDYNYTILGDTSIKRAVSFEAEANVHLIAGSSHEVFVTLFDAAYMLDSMLSQNQSKWSEASRNDKYELIRVQNQLVDYQTNFAVTSILIIIILAGLLAIIYYNYRKFINYDRQISQMLSIQKNADMLWGNTRSKSIISKGGFPFFKAWGFQMPQHNEEFEIFHSFEKDFEKLKEGKESYIETETTITSPQDNSTYYVRQYTHKISDSKFMVFALDVTDEKLREESLSQLANTDSLSSLLTRRAMENNLEKLIHTCDKTAETLFMLMFDIDNFKKVNDSYGHDIGDQALILVAYTIKERMIDCLASRWGGEEFLVAVRCSGKDEVISLANDILEEIAQKEIMVGKRTHFSVTVSCGIAPLYGTDYGKAITYADRALYVAKGEGKNCVRFME